jgi:hypothetical protein
MKMKSITVMVTVARHIETGAIVFAPGGFPESELYDGELVSTYVPRPDGLFDVEERLNGEPYQTLTRQYVSPETYWRLSCIEQGWSDEQIRQFEQDIESQGLLGRESDPDFGKVGGTA